MLGGCGRLLVSDRLCGPVCVCGAGVRLAPLRREVYHHGEQGGGGMGSRSVDIS